MRVGARACGCATHVEDGDDGRVVPADDGGHVLRLGDFGGDQLKVKNGRKRGPPEGGGERGREGERERAREETHSPQSPRVLRLN